MGCFRQNCLGIKPANRSRKWKKYRVHKLVHQVNFWLLTWTVKFNTQYFTWMSALRTSITSCFSIVMIGAICVGVYFYKRRHKFVENDKSGRHDGINQNGGFNNSAFEADLQVIFHFSRLIINITSKSVAWSYWNICPNQSILIGAWYTFYLTSFSTHVLSCRFDKLVLQKWIILNVASDVAYIEANNAVRLSTGLYGITTGFWLQVFWWVFRAQRSWQRASGSGFVATCESRQKPLHQYTRLR